MDNDKIYIVAFFIVVVACVFTFYYHYSKRHIKKNKLELEPFKTKIGRAFFHIAHGFNLVCAENEASDKAKRENR